MSAAPPERRSQVARVEVGRGAHLRHAMPSKDADDQRRAREASPVRGRLPPKDGPAASPSRPRVASSRDCCCCSCWYFRMVQSNT